MISVNVKGKRTWPFLSRKTLAALTPALASGPEMTEGTSCFQVVSTS